MCGFRTLRLVKRLEVGNCRDWSQRNPTSLGKALRQKKKQNRTEHVSSSDEGSLFETLDFFEISHGSYQPLNLRARFNSLRSILILYHWSGCRAWYSTLPIAAAIHTLWSMLATFSAYFKEFYLLYSFRKNLFSSLDVEKWLEIVMHWPIALTLVLSGTIFILYGQILK